MSWFNVDDKAHSDDCFHRVGLDGFGLWAAAGSYCMDYLTDGFVPGWFIDNWCGGPEAAAKLVSEGIWARVDGGCRYVEWKEELTRVYVEERKAQWRARKQRQREMSQRDSRESHSGTTAKPEVDADVPHDSPVSLGGSLGIGIGPTPTSNDQQPTPNDQSRKGHLEDGGLGEGDFSGLPVEAEEKRSPAAAGSLDWKERSLPVDPDRLCIICKRKPVKPGLGVCPECLTTAKPNKPAPQAKGTG